MPLITPKNEEVIFQAEPRRYFYKGKPYRSVTEVIRDVGFGPDFSHVDPAVMAYAQRRGNMVDLALCYHYEGDLDIDSVDTTIRAYFNAALKFDQECPGKIVALHPRLCSEMLHVAGTPDIIRFVRGHRAVVDWKTGVDNPLQTCMYQILWNAEHANQPCYERYGLKLNANGIYRLKEHNDPDDVSCSMAILTGDKEKIEYYRPKYGRKES